jgi:Holliday junction resolvase
MNIVRKGTRAETERVKMWEAHGYQVVRTIRSRFMTYEIFGNFDILAFNGNELVLEQVKCGKARPGRKLRSAMRAWKQTALKCHDIPVRMLIAWKQDRKGWTITEVV